MNTQQNFSPRENLKKKYDNCRSNLLLVIIFTVINCILLFTKSETMFLFSATIPYFVMVLGVFSEIYELLIASIVIAVVIVVLYFLCWLFSKKRYGWLIAALVLFSLDTLALIGLYLLMEDFSGIFDLLVHIWVLYYLISGIVHGVKLKKTPEDEPAAVEESSENADSSHLYMADYTVKAKVLLEETVNGYRICYRRVKRVNELIVNDRVYDTYEALIEQPHTLTASLDGHIIEAGMSTATSTSFIKFDGQTVKKKLRII